MDEAPLNLQPELWSTDKPFIQANTEEAILQIKNKVCTNLCVWSDGLMNDLKVSGNHRLSASIFEISCHRQSISWPGAKSSVDFEKNSAKTVVFG